MKKYGKYYATIGLEIHVALKTKTKLFSRSLNEFEGEDFALLDAGTPGVLPVLSSEPVAMAIAFALATSASVEKYSEFERKHYFYPDLPLGYQITQQHKPIMIGGLVPIMTEDGIKQIQIEHAHLECDAAKSIHDKFTQYTAIDLSRCASPLLEIVSTPCMHSPEEAKEYAKTVHALAMFLDICDGKMEEGSFRVDASISLHTEIGKLGTRVENKNISSFGFLQTALDYEIERQAAILDRGEEIVMETRLFDESSMTTKSMRLKETVDEYRYMPDPDLPPLYIAQDFIDDVWNVYPVSYFFLKDKLSSLMKQYGMDTDQYAIAQLLTSEQKLLWVELLHVIEQPSERLLRMVAYWMPEAVSKTPSDKKIELEDLIELEKTDLQSKEIKETISTYLLSDKTLSQCMPVFMKQEDLARIIHDTLTAYPDQIAKYKSDDVKMIQFLMGKVMSVVKGKAPATMVKEQTEIYLKK